MMFTDDPLADYDRYSTRQEKQFAKLPVCCECGEPIQDDYCYEINDELLCEDCLNTYHRKAVDDYAE